MDTGNDSTVQANEVKGLFKKERLSVTKRAENDLETHDLQNGEKEDKIASKDRIDSVEYTPVSTNENIEISIWKSKKLRINRSLIPLRTSQFLFFASGSFCGYFFSLMLTHRGLTLKDFSIVFSMIFLWQLVVAYIGGIVADKLGNAKPVLLFYMLFSLLSVVGLLISPKIEKSCEEHKKNETCLHIFNYTSDLEYCKYICSKNNTNYFLREEKNNSSNDLVTFSKEMDSAGNNGVLEDVLSSNETAISCNQSCFCFDLSAKNCFSTNKYGIKLLYAALIWSFFSFWSTSYRFLDFASLTVAKKHNSSFGNERAFGVLGILVATTLCNFVLNIDKSKAEGFYENIYWLAVVMFILSLISACFISEVISPPGIKLTKKTLQLFTDAEIMAVIFIAFVTGSAFSFNLFYHLFFLDKSLKASKTILGLHIMTSSLYGLPIYLTSKYWIRKLDMKKIAIISLICYSINATCYSFLYYPWLSLIIELTKALSFHLFWVFTVTYSNKIAPEGLTATVNAIVGTVHFGIGRSFSVSVGGYLMSVFGARTAYRILAGFCLTAAVLYATFQYFRHLCSEKDTKALSKKLVDTRQSLTVSWS